MAERLHLEAKGRTTSAGLDVDTMFGQLLRRMTDETARHGVVVPDGPPLTAVCRIPERSADCCASRCTPCPTTAPSL
jgi:hypothetical protein